MKSTLQMPTHSSVEFQISGDRALFSEIITRVGGEKFTTPIPSYEAIKGILQSVYWKPTIIWVIDEVRVMNKIQTERKSIKTYVYSSKDPSKRYDLSYYTYLTDVVYQVRAHFEWNPNRPELAEDRIEQKHLAIANRMIRSGGRRDVFLGTRECQAYVEPCVFGEGTGFYDHVEEIPYGLSYHGLTYADEAILPEDKGFMTVRFWQPVMKHGIIQYVRPEECVTKHHVKKMPIKVFSKQKENFTPVTEEVF